MHQQSAYQRKLPSQHCRLVDVLANSPPLLAVLDTTCKTRLAACNKELRQTMLSFATAVSFVQLRQHHIDSERCPQLRVVLLLTQYTQDQVADLSNGSLTGLAVLGTLQTHHKATLAIRQHTEPTDAAVLVEAAVRFLGRPKYFHGGQFWSYTMIKLLPGAYTVEFLCQLKRVSMVWQLDLSSVQMTASMVTDLLSICHQPRVIMLSQYQIEALAAFKQHGISPVATFGMHTLQGDPQTMILSPKLSEQQSRTYRVKTAASIIAQLSRSEYYQLTAFSILASSFLDHGTFRPFQPGNLRNLRQLNLSGCQVQLPLAHQLGTLSWPQLQTLSLSNCNLYGNVLEYLMMRTWSSLTHLDLSHNPKLRTGMSHLSNTAAWPMLHSLGLSGINLCDSTFASAMRGYNVTLQKLKIGHPDSSGVPAFASMPWISLTCLTIQSDSFDVPAALTLAHADLPELADLCLKNCKLKEAAKHLAEGMWSKLQSLDLSCNELDNWSMGQLARGQWPLLKHLWLQHNHADAGGLAALVSADWPQLADLTLDVNCVALDKSNLLSLDVTALDLAVIRN